MKKHIGITLLCLTLCICLAAPCLADALGSAHTYMYDDTPAMFNNLDLAISAVDDETVEAGKTFSFNKTVGARTKANGYKYALNGRGTKVMGGGVAQVATTLYLALKQMPGRVTIREKHIYGNRFAWDYAEIKDAILVDYKSGKDFRFKNVSGQPMTIHMRRQGEVITCQITLAGETPDDPEMPDDPDVPDDPDNPDDPEEPIDETPKLYKVYRCKEYINLRKKASTSSQSIAEIPLDATVLILSTTGKMCKAEFDGLTGYVNRKYVKPVPAAKVRKIVKCSSYISLREEPASNSPRLDKLFKGTLVEYLDESENGFTWVRYEDKTGYALTKYLKRPE